MIEQKNIRLSWDQFQTIEKITEIIEPLISDNDEIEIVKNGVHVRANQQSLTIIILDE